MSAATWCGVMMNPDASSSTRADFADAGPRWAAMVARDAGPDGTFCDSVDAIGVYCRPSCGSRMARPAIGLARKQALLERETRD